MIHFPTEAEARQQLADAFTRLRGIRALHVQNAERAHHALPILCDAMRHRTGQGYKLRRLLFSLWSGTPGADLSDVLALDYELRSALACVLMGWGCASTPTQPEFFYAALEAELTKAGLFDWFREEGGDK